MEFSRQEDCSGSITYGSGRDTPYRTEGKHCTRVKIKVSKGVQEEFWGTSESKAPLCRRQRSRAAETRPVFTPTSFLEEVWTGRKRALGTCAQVTAWQGAERVLFWATAAICSHLSCNLLSSQPILQQWSFSTLDRTCALDESVFECIYAGLWWVALTTSPGEGSRAFLATVGPQLIWFISPGPIIPSCKELQQGWQKNIWKP